MSADIPTQSPVETATSAEDQTQIPQIRLEMPLPPLPRMRIDIPFQTDSPLSAYTDDSSATPDTPKQHSRIMLKDSHEGPPIDGRYPECERTQAPPEYEPMNDYLRALALQRPERSSRYYSPTSNTFLSPSSRPQTPGLYMPYTDSPTTGDDGHRRAIITLSPLSADTPSAPPAYEELYLQHPCPAQQSRLLELVRQLEASDRGPNLAEEVCKIMVGVVFIVLTVLAVGMSLNWGQPPPNFGTVVTGHHAAAPIVQSAKFGHAIVPGGVPIIKPIVKPVTKMHDLSRLGSMTKVGKFKTLCGGRCKLHSAE